MAAVGTWYHVGIVVPDLEAARNRLSRLLGVRWGPVVELDAVPYRDGAGRDVELPTALCYSASDPGLELIQECPGSVWVTNPYSNLHHLGFWTEGMGAVSDELTGAGCPLELCGRSGAGAPVSFAYHRDPLGVRIEVVDAAMREAMAALFTPGGP
jgi:catechol 2,3-dioxygenase-like lactoylglutathione lyase family enzyme